MNSSDVTKAQAKVISAALYKRLNYLGRLRKRMDQLRFSPDDELYKLVAAVWDKLHRLSVHVHYMACGIGGGPSPHAHDSPPTVEE
jgi:hypothetical protein